MSRAFIREPDAPDPACPECGAAGEAVRGETLAAHLRPEDAKPLGDAAFYCSVDTCTTGYFTSWGDKVAADRMTSTAWPKDPDAPICSCFGMTAEEVIQDALDGRKDRVRDLVRRAEGPEAQCRTRAPGGAGCLKRVLRLFREKAGQ